MRSSLKAFHDWTCSRYERRGAGVFPAYNTFRGYFYAWLSRLETPKKLPRCCPVCLLSPRVVLCDGSPLSLHLPAMTSFSGKVLPMSKHKYHGTPVTTPNAEAAAQMEPAGRRMDRCFIVGGGQAQADARTYLRVLAGVRRRARDPATITKEELSTLLAACPAEGRYALLRCWPS